MKRRAFLASLAVVPAAVLLPKPTPRVPIFHPDLSERTFYPTLDVRDAQARYNLMMSAVCETVSMKPRTPWVMTCS